MIDKQPVTIEISGIEIVALKKLSLVSHALIRVLDHSAGQEQKCLVDVLDDIIRQVEINRLSARQRGEGVE